MMNNLGFVPVICVLVGLCLWIPTPGSALRCHVCNSLYNESCEALPDSRYLKDCMEVNEDPDRNHTLCRKEVFSVSSKEFKMSSARTIRTCGYEKHPKFSCFYNSNHDLKETICECIEDGCNGSTILDSARHFLALALLTIFLASSVFT